MNKKSFLLLWCLCVTLSLPTFAGLIPQQFPCGEATCISLAVGGPNDGPAQDGKDPTTPNQFAARLEDRTLVVTTALDETVSLKLHEHVTNKDVANLTFVKNVSCPIVQYGWYVLTLQFDSTTLTGSFDVELSQDEAADIALKIFENDNVEIFVSNTTYEPEDTIHVLYEQLKNEYIVAENRCWVAFVDLIPAANWAHECQYLLIDAKSGNVVTYNRDMPPKDLAPDFFKQYKSFNWTAETEVFAPGTMHNYKFFRDGQVIIQTKNTHYNVLGM